MSCPYGNLPLNIPRIVKDFFHMSSDYRSLLLGIVSYTAFQRVDKIGESGARCICLPEIARHDERGLLSRENDELSLQNPLHTFQIYEKIN